MTRWGRDLARARDDIRGRVGEHPPERRRRDRHIAWGVSLRSHVVSNPTSPQRGRQVFSLGREPQGPEDQPVIEPLKGATDSLPRREPRRSSPHRRVALFDGEDLYDGCGAIVVLALGNIAFDLAPDLEAEPR